ncbi:MAG: metal-dependent transcriptional regulator [Candidatus Brocadiaceae bacterium]|nr:metal-dependent transcriptional regulator [Candidatus Brocadiaceae bacterium]
MALTGQLSAALEDYLEAIYRLEREKRFARVRDISAMVNVAKSAVTTALQSLSDKGLVNYEPYEPVTLSPEGRERAGRILLRHRVIRDFLEGVLGLEAERSDSMACRMEHAIDRETLDRLVCFLAFVGRRRDEGDSWLEEFRRFARGGSERQACELCIRQYLQDAELE